MVGGRGRGTLRRDDGGPLEGLTGSGLIVRKATKGHVGPCVDSHVS